MRHAPAVGEDGFDAAETGGDDRQFDPLQQRSDLALFLEFKGEDGAGAACLGKMEGAGGKVGEAGIVDAADSRVGGEAFGEDLGVALRGLQAQLEGLDAATEEEGIEGGKDGAKGVLKELEALGQRRVGGGDKSGEKIGMAAEEFGGAVNGHIDTEVEGTLQQRGHEGVIEEGEKSAFLGEGSDGSEVDDFEEGIRWRFQEDGPGFGTDGGRDRGKVGLVDEGGVDAVLGEDLGDVAPGAAVKVIGGDKVIAAFEEGKGAADRRHPGWIGKAAHPAFEEGDRFLDLIAAGITAPRIVVLAGFAASMMIS